MRVQLFGVGTKSKSPAITAQRRINCRVDIRKEVDKSHYAIVGRFGTTPFVSTIGNIPSRYDSVCTYNYWHNDAGSRCIIVIVILLESCKQNVIRSQRLPNNVCFNHIPTNKHINSQSSS